MSLVRGFDWASTGRIHNHGQPYRISHPPRPAVSPEPRLAGPGALPDAPGAPGASRVRFSTRRHADAHSRLLGNAVSGPARSGPPERLDFSRKPHPGAVVVPVRRLSACVIWVFQCPIGCLQPLTTIPNAGRYSRPEHLQVQTANPDMAALYSALLALTDHDDERRDTLQRIHLGSALPVMWVPSRVSSKKHPRLTRRRMTGLLQGLRSRRSPQTPP